jgi:hypothetical protein
MSDYGMLVNNESGQARLSITDRTMRLAGVFTVGQNETGSRVISGITGHSPYAFVSVYNTPVSSIKIPHVVTISGDTVSYAPGPGIGVTFPWPYGPSIIWIYVTA